MKMPVTPNSSDDAPDQVGIGIIEGAFVGDGGAAHEQGSVDDVAVTDYPADVGGGPPNVGRLHAETPLGHAVNADLVAAVGVDDQLGLGGGAGGGQDECGFVGLHANVIAALTVALGDEILPG